MGTLVVDSRVPRRLPELAENAATSLQYLEDLPRLVYEVAATACCLEMDGVELRAEALLAAFTAFAYIDVRFLQPARQWPWRLVHM